MNKIRHGLTVLAGLLTAATQLTAAPELTQLVPASAPVVLHVRSIPELRSSWKTTSFARAWADPEIRKFLAPMTEMLTEGEDGLAAAIEAGTGLSADEFLGLFQGEAILAIKDLAPVFKDEADEPSVLFAIEIGDATAKVEAALAKGREKTAKDGDQEAIEEFQGEKIHVTLKPSADDPEKLSEKQAWAIVDGVFVMAEPKSVVQETIVAIKKGGLADPIAGHPSLASMYKKSPDTHAAVHLGLDSFVGPALAALESTEGQTDAEGNPTGFAAQLANLGLTPKGFFQTLGLDALRSVDISVSFLERETVVEGDLTWTERRGLLRMFAMGEPPVPLPDFVPESWVFAGVDRFSLPEAYKALMETLAELSPMLDGLVRQQIKQINTQLGVDLETDLIGSFGDVMVSGYAAPPAGVVIPGQPLDQFFSVSLSNPDAFIRVIDALLGGSPLGAMLETREYLGETIRGMTAPDGKAFAFAVTRGHLLVSVGSPAMLESAIQGLQGGATKPFWKKTEVTKALGALPDGACSVLVADLGRMMDLVVNFLVEMSAKDEDEGEGVEEGEEMEDSPMPMPFRVDPSARPSPETIAKYWSTMSRGLYPTSNGYHLTLKMANGQ